MHSERRAKPRRTQREPEGRRHQTKQGKPEFGLARATTTPELTPLWRLKTSAPLWHCPAGLCLSLSLFLHMGHKHRTSTALSSHSGGETPKLVGRILRRMYITRGDLPLRKTIVCLATLRSRLLVHGSAVRGGLRLIDTPRRGARDLSFLHGRDCAARKVRASASEVKGGGGYGHPLTHGPVFQRDKRIIERSGRTLLNRSNRCAEALRAVQESASRSLPFSH